MHGIRIAPIHRGTFMENFRNSRPVLVQSDITVDQGLRTYMVGIYRMMALGLVVTGLAAYLLWSFATTSVPSESAQFMVRQGLYLTPFGRAVYASPLSYLIMFAPVILVLFLNFGLHRIATNTAQMLFFVYALLVGFSLSSIFLTFTATTIAQTFFITAATFGALSIYGYTTHRDLRPFGTFLFMAVLGIFIASLVNIFLHSSQLQFFISIIGVLLFSGLTAYDTQMIKAFYYEHDDHDTMMRKIIIGALNLYIDFINMFISILQFLNYQNRN